MSFIEVININESEKWDDIVRNFENYDVYYLSGYTRAFQIHGDGEPYLIFYKDKLIRAINVVMKRDIENDRNFTGKIQPNSFFDVTTPYGYGGFLIEGEINTESLKALDNAYTTYCKNSGIISEFVRFHPVIKNYKNLDDMYNIVNLGKTVSINLKSKTQIWSDFTSKNRNMIRKAQKNGVKIYWGCSQELFNQFIGLYNVTMKRDNAKEYYYFSEDFYRSVLYDLKHNSLIFYAVFEEKIVAMSIVLFVNQKMHYHLSCSDKEYQHLAPTNLLLYEAACWGCDNGYQTFHLGGGLGSREDSLYKFKKAFNRNFDNVFVIGKKIFDNEKYENLVFLRGNKISNDANYFPEYRS
ncbi:MAG: lipid II:glycine glycyltransferase FemX [Peptococcales bacterium]